MEGAEVGAGITSTVNMSSVRRVPVACQVQGANQAR